ncbi:MAG: oligosaccharide flippase family protein, partial [Prolixibacteraceae bacterium]
MKLQKYITNISGLQVFQLLRFGTLLLISIVFAKSSLSTDAIGRYELFLFIVALFSSFWINGLIQAFLPLYKSNKSFNGKTVRSPEIFNVWLLISFLTLLVIFILIIFNRTLAVLLTSQDSFPYLPLIVLYLFFINPSYLIEYIYLLKNRPRSILKYGFTVFPLQFLLVSLPAILGYSLEYCLAGLVVSAFIRYLWLLAVLKKYALFKFSGAFIREHLHYGYPLILTAFLGASASYIDGFLVLNQFDSSTFAIFRYGAKEFPLVLLMASALSNAMIPEFSQKETFTASLSALRNKTKNLMHLLFPVT